MIPLPLSIYELVVEYLDTSDLLQVCLVSKAFHQISATNLYRQIIFTESINVSVARQEMKYRGTNKATVLDLQNEEKIEMLLDTMCSNEQLAAMVDSVIVSPTSYFEDDEWLDPFLQLTQVRSFHYKNSMAAFPGEVQSIERLSYYLPELAKVKPFARLTDLSVFYEGLSEDRQFFKQVASKMIESDTYRILRKLRFIHSPMEDFSYIPWMNQEECIPVVPEWVSFLRPFVLKEVKLGLTCLELDREFGCDPENVVKVIDQAVDLENLKALTIKVVEQEVRKKPASLLELLCEHTPSLTSLSISRAHITQSKIDSIARTLRDIIPNQLTKLWLRLDRRDPMDTGLLRQVIPTSQHNLVLFRIEDGAFLDLIDIESSIKISFGQWLTEVINCEWRIEEITLREYDIEQPISYVSEKKAEILKKYTKEILKMSEAHAVFSAGAENLPYLTKCCLNGVWINMKVRAFTCHDGDVPFE